LLRVGCGKTVIGEPRTKIGCINYFTAETRVLAMSRGLAGSSLIRQVRIMPWPRISLVAAADNELPLPAAALTACATST